MRIARLFNASSKRDCKWSIVITEVLQLSLSYTLDQKIGRGNFADVWRAHHDLSATQNSKITVAIKVIDKRERSESDLTKINREIEILKKLRHPHIIRLYQVFESGNFIFLGEFLLK